MNYLHSLTGLYESDYSSGSDNMIATFIDLEKIEHLNVHIKIGNFLTALVFDSGSACNFLYKSFAARVIRSNPQAIWVSESNKP